MKVKWCLHAYLIASKQSQLFCHAARLAQRVWSMVCLCLPLLGICAAHAAAAGGHIAALVWLLSQQPPCPIDAMSTMVAAKAGNIEVSRSYFVC
jgi:hypothetical protein